MRKPREPRSRQRSGMQDKDRKQTIQRYYSARAGDYDRQKIRTWKTQLGFGKEVLSELLEALERSAGKLVLEVGVGTARNALPLLDRVPMRYVGLDLSREMLLLARNKTLSFKQHFDLILGDADCLPFINNAFDAVICISTLHYLSSPDIVLRTFSEALKENGILVYGDVTVHESDNERFLEKLERTISKGHAGYCKPSEMKAFLEASHFHVLEVNTIAYEKPYESLMENKAKYFNVTSDALQARIQKASMETKKQYHLTVNGLTLFYTIIVAQKEKQSPTWSTLVRSRGIKVLKRHGETALTAANKLGIVNTKLEVQRDDHFIYVPLTAKQSEDALEKLGKCVNEFEIVTRSFSERKTRVTSYVDLLEGHMPAHAMANLPHAIDFIGDIAVIEIPQDLQAHRSLIGEAILRTHKNVRTVLSKESAIDGAYRLREFSFIAGEKKTVTTHKEYESQYYVDVAKAYFSPRLSNEHNRVASLVQEDETVVDFFAGVGPFAIQTARKRKNVKVFAIDLNPDAIEFLKKNVRLNRVETKIDVVLGDARQVVKKKLAGVADRVIMNLPEKSIEFVDAACETLKPSGGIVHFYYFVNTSNPIKKMQLLFNETVKGCGRNVERILCSKLVRATAPYEWQAVFDAEIC